MAERDSTFYRYSRMMPYIMRQWRGLAIILVLTIISASTTALMPWPLKILVDYAVGGLPFPHAVQSILDGSGIALTAGGLVVTAGLVSLLLHAINTGLDVALTWVWSASGLRMVYNLAADLFGRLQRLSLSFHDKRTVGDSLSRLSGDTWCTYKLASDLLISPVQQIFTVVTISAVAWTLDPGLTMLMLAVAPVLAVSARYFGRRLKQRARQRREAQSRMTSFVHQTLTAIPVVHAFTSEPRNVERFSQLSSQIVVRAQQGVLVKHTYAFVNGFSMAVGIAFILYFGGQRVLADALSVGSLLVFIAYVQSLKKTFGALLQGYGNLKTTEASVDRVLEVLDSEEMVWERPGAWRLPAPASKQGMAVRLEGVSFGYEPGHPVLEDVTLEAQPGETIALVGATGAGKSTLASLIPRFFDPWSGRVLIDGMDVRELALASLRSQIALVLQEPFLLPLTVAENIAYGRPEASHEEIEAAAVAANADEFIQHLPEGYDTVISERGASLSGGQRQRIAIARALLKDAPILILDEPTSALDAGTESLLLEALERLMTNRTTFIIAHRLSTIRDANRIVVIEGGKVVESGTHNDLMAAHGQYYRYQKLQSPGVATGVQGE